MGTESCCVLQWTDGTAQIVGRWQGRSIQGLVKRAQIYLMKVGSSSLEPRVQRSHLAAYILMPLGCPRAASPPRNVKFFILGIPWGPRRVVAKADTGRHWSSQLLRVAVATTAVGKARMC